ncbi:MAG: NAD-dependent DNA ligase LigA [Spirochaetia bacterium]|jgi:DNA ligase (NAD+)|nr:NAD-dependent DNA ligase LigA [Spirochaetia bacterium]
MASNPSRDNTEARIKILQAAIKTHQNLYYNHQPTLSDEEFDALWAELEDLDPDNPLLGKVGEDLADGWPKIRHIMPMGSQAKASDPESFAAWAEKANLSSYVVQYKLDGASIELQYQEGRFVRAVTRGDGSIGDDISPNARRMKGILPSLPESFSGAVRGEVLMAKNIHAQKYPDKANCRNAANGIMKRKDGLGSEDLVVICYDALGSLPSTGGRFLFSDGETMSPMVVSPFKDELEKIGWLSRMGFITVHTELFTSVEELIEYRAKVMALRPELEFDIDGLVVKDRIIDTEDAAKTRPEKQIAFKFNPEEAVTRLKAVEWSETGASYTPIGIVEPVRLAGTTVQRANLNNPGMIRKMGLKIGSMVVITKRGEIIPKIEALVENPPHAEEILQPDTCESCGSKLVDADTRLYCPNELCPKKELHRLEKWLTVLDIREFGPALIARLHDSGKLRTIADLYSLRIEELENIERMGRISAQKVLKNLHAAREISLQEFIAGFDLEGVGLLVADKIVGAGYDSLDALLAVDKAALAHIPGIAEIMAESVWNSLRAVETQMKTLAESGAVRIKAPTPQSGGGEPGAVRGRSFCFTGELSSMKRQEAERRVRELGGSAKNSVTKDLDYLVTNAPESGSSKNIKAKSLGVAILDEKAFLGLLRQALENPGA